MIRLRTISPSAAGTVSLSLSRHGAPSVPSLSTRASVLFAFSHSPITSNKNEHNFSTLQLGSAFTSSSSQRLRSSPAKRRDYRFYSSNSPRNSSTWTVPLTAGATAAGAYYLYEQYSGKTSSDAESPSPSTSAPDQLSPSEVDTLLRSTQRTFFPGNAGHIRRVDFNSVPSNDPIEDYYDFRVVEPGSEPHLPQTSWFSWPNSLSTSSSSSTTPSSRTLIAIFDGHSGTHCASVLSQSLTNYAALEIYRSVPPLESEGPHSPARRRAVTAALEAAFVRLDADITSGRLPAPPPPTSPTPPPKVPLAGSCALLAYIDGSDLYVACTGDSRAVLARRVGGDENGNAARWVCDQLTEDQTARNPDELRRMLMEHPGEEYTVVSRGRVLGSLMPTRAFGDARYKWPLAIPSTRSLLLPPTPFYGPVMDAYYARGGARYYLTPPYVTARPVVSHRLLPSSPCALVMATDGLWDFLSSESAVDGVAGSFGSLSTQRVDEANISTGDNPATALIRESLGGSNQAQVSALLSLPRGKESRRRRDDVTVAVSWLDASSTNSFGSGHTTDRGLGFSSVDFSHGEAGGEGLMQRWVDEAARIRREREQGRKEVDEAVKKGDYRRGDVVGG